MTAQTTSRGATSEGATSGAARSGWAKGGIALLLASALVGCQIAPDKMVLPTPTSTPAWREGVANDVWPAPDWWKAFGSPELDSLIAKAEHDNDDLAAAVARVSEADAQARIAGAPLLPSVSVSPEATAVRRNSPLGKERHYGDFTGVFSASYELDLWGKNRAALNAAKSSASAARYAREVVDLTTVTGVATVYIQVLGLQDQLATAQSNLDIAQAVLNDVQAKRQAGLATDLDVVNQQTVAETAREALAPLQEQRAHALDALAILTAQSPEALQITGKSLNELQAPAPDAGLPSRLLLHRPDVQQAEQTLAAADANIVVARAQFLPAFDLGTSVGVEAMGVASGIAGPSLIYDLALGAVQPIFEGGKLKGQLQYARARYAELLADYIKTTRQAYGDVEDALASVHATDAEQAADRAALDKAEQALRLTEAGYKAGLVDVFAVQAAQAAAFPNRTALAQADTAHLQSLIALYKALGGGWSLKS
jgi:outer membrane protein, multidrug efflux system